MLARVFDFVLDLFYPPKCAFCRSVLHAGEVDGFCAECADSLPYIQDGDCTKQGDHFSACISALYYTGTVRDSIHRYKFEGAALYCDAYGAILSDLIQSELSGRFDIITWVPVSRKRLKVRGYDQARLLAEAISQRLELKSVPMLQKHVDVKAQSSTTSAAERWTNISDVYLPMDEVAFSGLRILLIDDVMTTGATLSECAKTLLLAGAADVICATIARTPLAS